VGGAENEVLTALCRAEFFCNEDVHCLLQHYNHWDWHFSIL